MARALSDAFRRMLLAIEDTGERPAICVRISHATLADPLRFVLAEAGEGITRDGQGGSDPDGTATGVDYIPFPFDFAFPDERGDSLPTVAITIDNVDQRVVQAVRTIEDAPTVHLFITLFSDPNTIEVGPYLFTLRDATYTKLTVTGQLQYPDILNEPYPGDRMGPSDFPGLFR